MISKEEFALLQQKFKEQNLEKDRLSKQVMELTAQNQAIPQLRQRAAELKVENEKDDTKQMEELGVATAELKSLRQEISNVKYSQDSKKNVKLEQQLDTLFDQSRKLDKELAELEKIDKEYSDQEGPVDTQIAALIEHNSKIKALSEKVTRGRDYILRILEEEGRIHQLERMIEKASNELPELETLINNLENEKVSKLSEMRRITADIDAVIEKIKAGDHEHNERYRLLNKVSNQLQEVNDLTRNEKARVADIQIQYVKKTQDAVADAKKIQQKIEEYKKKISDFPEFKKAALVDLQTKVTKAKQLTDQLEQKRKELRNQIQQKILSSDIIVNLNKAMEEEWYNRQVLVDEENALKKELQKYTDTLKRKKLCSDEIERMFPRKHKPHKGAGIAELEHMYDQTLILNKKLAEAADDLREELEIHKNDYKLLRSFFEEGEKPAAK